MATTTPGAVETFLVLIADDMVRMSQELGDTVGEAKWRKAAALARAQAKEKASAAS